MLRLLIISFLFLCLVNPAHALRCGKKLIVEGDFIEEVRYLCGDPLGIETYAAVRESQISAASRDRRIRRQQERTNEKTNAIIITDGIQTEIIIEEWTYNFGPNRLMRRLFFENGILVEIKSLGYGFVPRRH